MDRKNPSMIFTVFLIVAGILTFIGSILIYDKRSSYSFYFLIAGGLLTLSNVYSHWRSEKKCEENRRLAERLFCSSTGAKPSKTEIIQRPVSKFDMSRYRITEKAIQVKFWLDEKACKGVLDTEKRILYEKECVLLPVYSGEMIAVWKDTIEAHSNGLPKKVEFYDEKELLHRVDHLDEFGNLVRESWRRQEGTVEYWNPKEEIWVPIP